MTSVNVESQAWEQRRRWIDLLLGGFAVLAPLLLGIPAWIFAFCRVIVLAASNLIQRVDAWLDRGRRELPADDPPGHMRYSKNSLIVASVGTAFFLTFALCETLAFFAFRQIAGIPAFGLIFIGIGGPMFLALAAWSGRSVLQCLRIRLQVQSGGLCYQGLTTEGFLDWNDVRRVTYSTRLCQFRLEAADGAVVSVSSSLTGLPEFALAVKRFVPWNAIDDSARLILNQTACGTLPRALM